MATAHYTKIESDIKRKELKDYLEDQIIQLSSGEGGKAFQTLIDAQAFTPTPSDNTIFQVLEQANEGYHIWKASAPGGTEFYKPFESINYCFKETDETYTQLERKIREAIRITSIWGDNVDPNSEEYYLHKIAKNRDTYNDSYIQIKNTSGTLIAYIPLGIIPSGSGVLEHEVNEYIPGYNLKVSINWDILENNTAYVGSQVKMTLDPLKSYIKQEKELTDLPLLNRAEFNNSCFFRNDDNNYTTIEQSIRNAFLEIDIWGKSVAQDDKFYLARLGYDREHTNDIYFQIKREDGTLIAFIQFDKTVNDTGVKTYFINNYLEGYNVKIILNWEFIPEQTDYISGNLDKMQFDPEKCYIQKVKKDPITTKNRVIRKGDKLYILSKWNNEYDLLITFEKCMFNELMTFSGVHLLSNNDEYILDQYDKSPFITLNNVDSDNIGPYIIKGESSWVGGNHGFEGVFNNLTSEYIAGETILNVADGNEFVMSGGWARTGSSNGYVKFQYAGVSGNQLTGVTGLNINMTTSDQVQVYHLTAETVSFDFYVDGQVLPENVMLPANEVIVNVKNKVYDSSTLDFETGSMDDGWYEQAMYRVSEGNIETVLEHIFLKDIEITTYYGMQLLSGTWQQKVYQANAEDSGIKGKTDYINADTPLRSGDPFIYQSDKMIISKSNSIYNCAMWFDPKCGYAINKANYLDSGGYLWNGETNGKFYHGTILKDTSFVSGQREWWRGVYTWFPNSLSLVDASYAYEMRIAGVKHLCIDFHSSGNDNIPTIQNVGKEVEKIKADNTLTSQNDIMPRGLNIKSTGYGSGLYKVI